MDGLTSTAGYVALGAGGLALAACVACVVLALRLKRVRAAQKAVLGGEDLDLVEHAAGLHEAFAQLRAYVEEASARLEGRLGTAEDRLDRAITYRGTVRYDAYHELSGRQSSSVALLDTEQSGVVISSIHHRDQARVYVRQVEHGRSQPELSPEEAEAVRLALAGELQAAPDHA